MSILRLMVTYDQNKNKKKKKNTFPKEFFNEIWLKVGEYE